MDIQWYPGQMAKAKRLLRQDLKLVDAVIEVLDARLPASSSNPDLKEMLAARPVAAVLTRPDLADPEATSAWLAALRGEYIVVSAVNAESGQGVKELLQRLARIPRRSKSGNRPLRLLAAGIPNVGKSSLINRLTGRSAAVTGDKPGITKGRQWVRVRESLEILDTPGLLWPRIETGHQAFVLAAAGSVRDEVIDMPRLAEELLAFFRRNKPAALSGRYRLDSVEGPTPDLLERIGRLRGCLVRGGEVDLEAAARVVIRDFREGRLGRVTLEMPGETGEQNGYNENDRDGNNPQPQTGKSGGRRGGTDAARPPRCGAQAG
jgi:ribosome biogenesis GTPase A